MNMHSPDRFFRTEEVIVSPLKSITVSAEVARRRRNAARIKKQNEDRAKKMGK